MKPELLLDAAHDIMKTPTHLEGYESAFDANSILELQTFE